MQLTLLAAVAAPVLLTGGTYSRPARSRTHAQSRCAHVDTAQLLINAIQARNMCIFVDNDARIDLADVGDNPASTTESVLKVPDGVTLESGRSPTVPGGMLYLSHSVASKDPTKPQKSMLELGANTRVSGLRLRGYDQFDTRDRGDHTAGIDVRFVDGVLIDNNEIYGWPTAAVGINGAPNGQGIPSNAIPPLATVARVHVTGNYIHNNVQCNAGYGVVVGGSSGYTLIDRNVFDFNRHDVAADGTPHTGYVADANFSLTHGPTCDGNYNQHYDMHGFGPGSNSHHVGGMAGQYIEIRDNAIRGSQSYGFLGRHHRPAFDLRGTPSARAVFADNALAAEDEGAALKVEGAGPFGALRLRQLGKLVVFGNKYGVDTWGELAVGDFDGDGHADVFAWTGTTWVYSPWGHREWRFLNASRVSFSRLAFGDFNGDGKTDVFTQRGDQWLVSYGGTSGWQPLPAGSAIPMREYRFGDFDGDKKTDVFRANGSRFYYSSGGATAWQPLATSHFTVDRLRFGDFNGDGKTDVFSLANGQWSVSYGGASNWQRLNARLSSDLGELVFADFNGDGRTDIARTHDGNWQVSWGGTTSWQTLHRQPGARLSGMLFGDFTGDKRADVLQFQTSGTLIPIPLERFRLSSAGVGPLGRWSLQDMR